MHNNSRGKKLQVEEHRMNVKLPKNKTFVTACNDSLNAKTLNEKSVSAMCDKCVLIDKHDMGVLKSVAKSLKETVASVSNKKPRKNVRKLYERLRKIYKWSYIKFTPSGYMWKPKSPAGNVNPNLVEIILFIVDSGCSKHMTGNLKLLINFMEKFLGTVKFGNDQIAPILGYGDLNDIVVGLPKLKFIKDHRCSSCELGKAKRKSFHSKLTPSSKRRLHLLHIDLCGPIRVAIPLFFWAEAIATACFTQNRSLVIPLHEKTPYHIINDRKSSVKFFHIYGSVCYIFRDGDNLDKMKEKGDECIFVGYSTQSRAYRVFNKRTRVIMESIHVNFDELPQMASAHNSSDPTPTCQTMASVQISSDLAPECQTMALEHDSLSPGRKCQENVSHGDKTDTTSNELDLLFSPMFDELLNGSSKVVSKSSVVFVADALNQRQQPTTPLNHHTTPAPTCQNPSVAPTVISSENITQAEPHAENDQVADDEFINIFSTPVQDQEHQSSNGRFRLD
nr:integrase, catalytic region, zinc finger, CCHC-type, peptidase aspartic, catalytic [Tanacetum cinerariifolium]